MKSVRIVLSAAMAALSVTLSQAQYNIAPLAAFAGDGWFAPGEDGYAYLGTVNNERGLAYGNGQLYLVSRAGGAFIRRLNALTGADLGALDVTGVSGGTFAVNMVGVAGDGAIYVGNLTVSSSTSPFKVYRWANDAAMPTVAYSGDPFGAAARYGDSLAVFGSGASTLIAAGEGNTAAVGDNGFALIDPTLGAGSHVGVVGANEGDFRLGIDFVDGTHVIGTQGNAGGSLLRYTDTLGSLIGSGVLSTASQRPLGYTVLGGVPLLAALDTVDGKLRIYDATDPTNVGSPILFGGAAPFAHNSNGNATGDVAWSDPIWDGTKWNAYLYALESNNGIQAWVVSVPEPSTFATLMIGGGLLALSWASRPTRK